jgi:hypothetical protein
MEKQPKYITKRCHAPGCRNKASVKEGISLHRYPNKEKEPERYKKWLEALNLNQPLKSHFICSAHFIITDFYPISEYFIQFNFSCLKQLIPKPKKIYCRKRKPNKTNAWR